MNRTWTAGHDTVSTDKIVNMVMEMLVEERLIDEDLTTVEVRDKIKADLEGAVGLVGQVAYGQGLRHGRRARPTFEALKNAHRAGFDEGWELAMEARDDTADWSDDQRHGIHDEPNRR